MWTWEGDQEEISQKCNFRGRIESILLTCKKILH